MRQAGRYLPEYRELRSRRSRRFSIFVTIRPCEQVTLQPLRRFDLDAAILFSDILVVPRCAGPGGDLRDGRGPRLEPLTPARVATLRRRKWCRKLGIVLDTVARVEAALSPEKADRFLRCPVDGRDLHDCRAGSTDQAAAKLFAYRYPEAFAGLLDVLVEASAAYLVAQLRAGAHAVQIFESWASNLDQASFKAWVIEPNRRIVEKVRAAVPGAAVIGFPRGAASHLSAYAGATGVDVVGLDQAVPAGVANRALPAGMGVQGNLDPVRLVAGGAQMERRAEEIIEAFTDRPHIFNLGHGILPETPVEHVSELIRVVKGD